MGTSFSMTSTTPTFIGGGVFGGPAAFVEQPVRTAMIKTKASRQ
jgi:hypothetical protein